MQIRVDYEQEVNHSDAEQHAAIVEELKVKSYTISDLKSI